MSESAFGLLPRDMEEITLLLSRFPIIHEAILFGSRAKGEYRRGSDVDIALKGEITAKSLIQLSYLLNEESMMPYKFDLVDYHRISNPELKAHIDRVGITFYRYT